MCLAFFVVFLKLKQFANIVMGLKTLLVEDNELNQKFAIAVLKRLGHEVDLAVNGKIGFELYQRKIFDLILMDIQMPEMNGIECTVAIRELEKKTKNHIIIIAVTAFAMEHDKKNCFDAGMDDFLTKPYKPFELEDKIKQYFL
jgi:two-component system, sensor histidine kinase and response regulator